MIFFKFKQIMSFDKTNIHFLINSCELKVHPKNKCLNVSTSLQKAHVYVLGILYLSIKILIARI